MRLLDKIRWVFHVTIQRAVGEVKQLKNEFKQHTCSSQFVFSAVALCARPSLLLAEDSLRAAIRCRETARLSHPLTFFLVSSLSGRTAGWCARGAVRVENTCLVFACPRLFLERSFFEMRSILARWSHQTVSSSLSWLAYTTFGLGKDVVRISTGGTQQGCITGMRVATGSIRCVRGDVKVVAAIWTTLVAALTLPCTLMFLVTVVARAAVILGATVRSGLLFHA